MAKLDKIKHVPNIIEKSKKLEAEIAAKLDQAQIEADEIFLIAHKEAERMKGGIAARAYEAQQRVSEIIQSATREANSLKQNRPHPQAGTS